MIRLLFIFLSSCWFVLLYLKKAKRHKLSEMFHVHRIVPFMAVIVSALLFLSFLSVGAPQASTLSYYLRRSNDMIYEGDVYNYKGSIDGHELSIIFLSSIRFVTEQILGLSLIASIYIFIFVLGLLYCYAVYRLVLHGTKDKSLAILATILVPFSTFIFWFIQGGIYAHFISLSIIFLAFSFYFEDKTNGWKKASMLFLLAAIMHGWTTLLFFGVFTVYTVFAKLLKYKDTQALKFWGIQALMLGVICSFFFSYHGSAIAIGWRFLDLNPLFYAQLYGSPILAVLAIIGVTVIVSCKTKFNLFLFVYLLTFSSLVFLTDFVINRLIYAIPLTIFAVFGIHRLWCIFKRRTRVVLTITIILVILSGIYSHGLRTEIMQPIVSMDIVNRIQELRKEYGYGSYEITIVVDSGNAELVRWVEGLTGFPIVWHVRNYDLWYETYGHLEYDNWGRKIVMVEDSW